MLNGNENFHCSAKDPAPAEHGAVGEERCLSVFVLLTQLFMKSRPCFPYDMF